MAEYTSDTLRLMAYWATKLSDEFREHLLAHADAMAALERRLAEAESARDEIVSDWHENFAQYDYQIVSLRARLARIARIAACGGHPPLYSEACDAVVRIGEMVLRGEEDNNAS